MASIPTAKDVLVIASGADPELLRASGPADLVICADGGLDVAMAAGIRAHLVVGDLDSVTPEALAEATAAGTETERHQGDKDQSDLELALSAALTRSATSITVLLGAGGRLDHQLANLLVLASPRWEAVDISARVGRDRLWVIRGERILPLGPGDPMALHAIGGPADGIRTQGLAFELREERLESMSARGIANQVLRADPSVSVAAGVVLAISSPTR